MNNNKIKFIGTYLLDPLKSLQYANFGGNICIASNSRTTKEIEWLKIEMKLKCTDISMFDVMDKLHEIDKSLKKLEAFFQNVDNINENEIK
jgi:hypothetical protein